VATRATAVASKNTKLPSLTVLLPVTASAPSLTETRPTGANVT